ncbi:MAG: DUF3035 domain-containing protein [Pseudomonadota bacterium]
MNRRVTTMAALLAGAAALAGCDKIGSPLDVFAKKKPSPDEFKVVARAPLYVPPQVSAGQQVQALPEPRPGAPSPLDPQPGRDAQAALLGAGAGAAGVGTTPSRGEQVLVGAAATGADGEIRTALEADAVAEAEAEAAGPYVPPSIFEVIGLSEPPAFDPEDVIEPVPESQRLQRSGIPAPNDPTAVADPATAPAEGSATEG